MHTNTWTQNGSYQSQLTSGLPVCSEQTAKAKILRYLLLDDAEVPTDLQVENMSSLQQIHATPQTASQQVFQNSNQNFLNSSSFKNMQQNAVQSKPKTTINPFSKPGMTGSQQFVTQNDLSHAAKNSVQHGNSQTTLLGNRTEAKAPPPYGSTNNCLQTVQMSQRGTTATASSMSPITYNQSCNQRHISGSDIMMIQNDSFPKLSNLMSPCQPFSNNQGITTNAPSGQCTSMQSISDKYNGTNALPSTHSLVHLNSPQYGTDPFFPKVNWNLTNSTAHTVHHTGNSSARMMPGNAQTKQPYIPITPPLSAPYLSHINKKRNSSLFSNRKSMAEPSSTTEHNSNSPQGIISHSGQSLLSSNFSAQSSRQHIQDVPSSQNPVQQSYFVTVTEGKSGNGYRADKVMFLGNDRMFLQGDSQRHSSNELLAGTFLKRKQIAQTIPSTISSVELNGFAYQQSSGPTGEKAVAVVQPLSQASDQAVNLYDCSENVCTTTDNPVTKHKNNVDLRENDSKSIPFSAKSGQGQSNTLRPDITQTSVTMDLPYLLLDTPKSSRDLNPGDSQLLDDKQCQATQPDQDITQVPVRDVIIETRKETSHIDQLSSVPVIQWNTDEIMKLIGEVEKSNKQDDYPDIDVACKIISMYWENSEERLRSKIKTGAYQNVMICVKDFCQKHVKLDTIILHSVMEKHLNQLKYKCHVLQHDSVYPKVVYKSSWRNTNEQIDDIDKEYGFPWALKYGQQITVREDKLKLRKAENCILGNIGNMHDEVLNTTERDSLDVNKAAMPFQSNGNTMWNRVLTTGGREEELKLDETENGNLACIVNRIHYEVLTPTIKNKQPKLIETDNDGIQPSTTEVHSEVETHFETKSEFDEDCETQASSVFHSFAKTSFPLKKERANVISNDPFSSIEIHVLPQEEAALFFGETLFQKKEEDPQQNGINNSMEAIPKALHLDQLKSGNNVEDAMQEFCCLSQWMEVCGVADKHLYKTCQCRSKHGLIIPILNASEKVAQGTVAKDMAMPNYKLGLSAEEKTRDILGDAITNIKQAQDEQCFEMIDLTEEELSHSYNTGSNICDSLSLSIGHSNSNIIEIDSDEVFSRKEAEMASTIEPELDCGKFEQLDYSPEMIEHGQKQTISFDRVSSLKSESTSGLKSCGLELQFTEKVSYLASLSLRQNCKQRHDPKTTQSFKKVLGKNLKRLFESQSMTVSVKKRACLDSKPTLKPNPPRRHVQKQSHERAPTDNFELPCNIKTIELALFGSSPQRKRGTVQTGHSKDLVSSQASFFPDRPPLPAPILIAVVGTLRADSGSDTGTVRKTPAKKRIFEDWKNSFVPTKKARKSQSKNEQVFRQEVDVQNAQTKKPANTSNARLKNEKRAKGETERSMKYIKWKRVEKSKMGVLKLKKSNTAAKSVYELGNPALVPLQQNSCLKFNVLPKSFNFQDSGKNTESMSVDGPDPIKNRRIKRIDSKGAWATDCEKDSSTLSSNTRKPTTSLFQEFQKKFNEKR